MKIRCHILGIQITLLVKEAFVVKGCHSKAAMIEYLYFKRVDIEFSTPQLIRILMVESQFNIWISL